MITYLRTSCRLGIISVLMMVAVLTLSGCGSSPPKQKGPAPDQALERFNRAARQAYDKGRLEQAANFYRKALERAYVRDDADAILSPAWKLMAAGSALEEPGHGLALFLAPDFVEVYVLPIEPEELVVVGDRFQLPSVEPGDAFAALSRAGLAGRGIAVPDDTLFVAALQDPTRDEIALAEPVVVGISD